VKVSWKCRSLSSLRSFYLSIVCLRKASIGKASPTCMRIRWTACGYVELYALSNDLAVYILIVRLDQIPHPHVSPPMTNHPPGHVGSNLLHPLSRIPKHLTITFYLVKAISGSCQGDGKPMSSLFESAQVDE
jgi:hypothetical protein